MRHTQARVRLIDALLFALLLGAFLIAMAFKPFPKPQPAMAAA